MYHLLAQCAPKPTETLPGVPRPFPTWGRPDRAATEHRSLLKYIASGDAEKAATAVRRHIERGWLELRKHLTEGRPSNDHERAA